MSTMWREVNRVRRIGEATPEQHQWGCRIDTDADGLTVRITAPEATADRDLDTSAARLHDELLAQVPRMLCESARSEVGVVRTETPAGVLERPYSLATCADVVITLAEELAPELASPWCGTNSPDDLDLRLPIVLGPSAVLSLAAGMLELADDAGAALPDWLSVHAGVHSPYPPHDVPEGLDDAAITWWTAHIEHWLRPMRTTRTSRGQYKVRAALPPAPAISSAVWIESLVSLDTEGHCWQASLSIERDGGRWWIAQPLPVEIGAAEMFGAAVGQMEQPRVALDRDSVDGESFGWAPGLLLRRPASDLGVGKGLR
ncbi:hypothetical protein [Streptomyces sp. NPDC058678]|uniref:hypothetical protein n=1 Tax=Streptomyces sp. NPDC058678 TaxID=3346595 RepID=UPI00365FD6F1